jgi:hypothetical protein
MRIAIELKINEVKISGAKSLIIKAGITNPDQQYTYKKILKLLRGEIIN